MPRVPYPVAVNDSLREQALILADLCESRAGLARALGVSEACVSRFLAEVTGASPKLAAAISVAAESIEIRRAFHGYLAGTVTAGAVSSALQAFERVRTAQGLEGT